MYVCYYPSLNYTVSPLPPGITHLLTVDLYHKEIQGFFDFPVDNLRASPFLIRYIKENVRGEGGREKGGRKEGRERGKEGWRQSLGND